MFGLGEFLSWIERNFGYIIVAWIISSIFVAYAVVQIANKLLLHFGINL